ncbi:central glycolytic genes regulator [Lactobacillus colini]|uniref:Central glycolytic genes regulator n=1 Tax=Lactobacillus colini TaxID=1819254 RepID=A0ABS4MDF8_9LACO|nr:sugar-binding domain-containing protein [Lactobacillus colini]MBP2057686.1 central glycolytic genes regulator [Lactobacillus colini]
MDSDLTLLQSLVPDILKIVRQRFLVLEQISLLAPVGRRVVAKKLGLSERNIRTETDYLRQLGLIEVRSYGMVLTEKGKRVLKEAAPMIDRVFNASQQEIKLAHKLGIERAIVVPGDLDRQERVIDLLSEELNSSLDLLLPLGNNIITVLGGSTVAGVAKHLSPKLNRYRELLFVPGRGAVGESVELQSNTVAQVMASQVGGQHKGLYLPENVSSEALRLLIQDANIANAISNIYNSNAVIHGIGRADEMVKRRNLDVIMRSKLREKGAVAECFGYFFDQQGRVIDRIPRIGLQLEDLDKIPHVFAVAAGASKANAIEAYMHHAPKQTWLITDEGASTKVLKGK